ncbi:hypothetical protein Cadr_000020299 [Camelus dromedarius]|uniref:Uncharacterized protein n=1 Tax=Camelus dromedarius TaxID=9838 RepID=A0A5N4CYW0_CAMDR|nr:hypothetical protein Cadr_000020299 [Camelus dromedarius]
MTNPQPTCLCRMLQEGQEEPSSLPGPQIRRLASPGCLLRAGAPDQSPLSVCLVFSAGLCLVRSAAGRKRPDGLPSVTGLGSSVWSWEREDCSGVSVIFLKEEAGLTAGEHEGSSLLWKNGDESVSADNRHALCCAETKKQR